MKVFLGERWRMGPQETLNLLYSPIADLKLDAEMHEWLISCGKSYVGDLLFMNQSETISIFGTGLFQLFKVNERLGKLSLPGITVGMFSHLPYFVKSLFQEAKGYRRVVLPTEKLFPPGNSHPAFPRSEAEYHGSIRGGEW